MDRFENLLPLSLVAISFDFETFFTISTTLRASAGVRTIVTPGMERPEDGKTTEDEYPRLHVYLRDLRANVSASIKRNDNSCILLVFIISASCLVGFDGKLGA